jgi:quercetin dioxygenase-like cupin family protein
MTPGPDELERDLLDMDALADERATPSAALREAVLASASQATPLAGFGPRLSAFLDVGRERAAELLRALTRAGEAPWVDGGPPGVRLLHFDGGPRHAGADCGLVQLAAGVRFPRHRHGGEEVAFVLSGEAEEEGTGAVWRPGDVVLRGARSAHAFRALGDRPFAFAVVLRDGFELEE